MGRSQREKGKRAEREAAELIRSWGIAARRGQQYAGDPDAPDVVAATPGLAWEVKARKQGHPGKWLEELLKNCHDGDIPVVLHKRDRQPWLLTIFAMQAPSFSTRLRLALRERGESE